MDARLFYIAATIAATPLILVAEHRLRRYYQRRCPCGCLRVQRIKKMRPNPTVYPKESFPEGPPADASHFETFIFGWCRKCQEFKLIRSENKCFSKFELWWRRTFYPHEFKDVEACLIRAGIDLVKHDGEPQTVVPKPILAVDTPAVALIPPSHKPFERHTIRPKRHDNRISLLAQ